MLSLGDVGYDFLLNLSGFFVSADQVKAQMQQVETRVSGSIGRAERAVERADARIEKSLLAVGDAAQRSASAQEIASRRIESIMARRRVLADGIADADARKVITDRKLSDQQLANQRQAYRAYEDYVTKREALTGKLQKSELDAIIKRSEAELRLQSLTSRGLQNTEEYAIALAKLTSAEIGVENAQREHTRQLELYDAGSEAARAETEELRLSLSKLGVSLDTATLNAFKAEQALERMREKEAKLAQAEMDAHANLTRVTVAGNEAIAASQAKVMEATETWAVQASAAQATAAEREVQIVEGQERVVSRTDFLLRRHLNDLRLFGQQALMAAAIAVAPFVLAAKQTVDFDKSIRRVNAALGVTDQELASVSDQLIGFGKEFGFMPTVVADAFNKIVRGGFKNIDDALHVLRASLEGARGGYADLGTTTEDYLKVLNAFNLQAKDASRVADILTQTSKDTGISLDQLKAPLSAASKPAAAFHQSVEEAAAAIGLLVKNSRTASQAGSGYARLLTSIEKPTKQTSALFQELSQKTHLVTLGLIAAGHGGEALQRFGLAKVLQDVNTATNGNAEALHRLIPLNQAYYAALVLGANGARDYGVQIARNAKSVGESAKASDQAMKSFTAQLQQFQAQLQGIGIQIGREVIPSFQDMVGVIHRLLDAWDGLPDPVKRTTVDIALFVIGVTAAVGATAVMMARVKELATGFKWLTGILGMENEVGGLGALGAISKWVTASGSAGAASGKLATALGMGEGGLAAALTTIGLVGAAAFAAWELTRIISEVTHLDEAIQRLFLHSVKTNADRTPLQNAQGALAYMLAQQNEKTQPNPFGAANETINDTITMFTRQRRDANGDPISRIDRLTPGQYAGVIADLRNQVKLMQRLQDRGPGIALANAAQRSRGGFSLPIAGSGGGVAPMRPGMLYDPTSRLTFNPFPPLGSSASSANQVRRTGEQTALAQANALTDSNARIIAVLRAQTRSLIAEKRAQVDAWVKAGVKTEAEGHKLLGDFIVAQNAAMNRKIADQEAKHAKNIFNAKIALRRKEIDAAAKLVDSEPSGANRLLGSEGIDERRLRLQYDVMAQGEAPADRLKLEAKLQSDLLKLRKNYGDKMQALKDAEAKKSIEAGKQASEAEANAAMDAAEINIRCFAYQRRAMELETNAPDFQGQRGLATGEADFRSQKNKAERDRALAQIPTNLRQASASFTDLTAHSLTIPDSVQKAKEEYDRQVALIGANYGLGKQEVDDWLDEQLKGIDDKEQQAIQSRVQRLTEHYDRVIDAFQKTNRYANMPEDQRYDALADERKHQMTTAALQNPAVVLTDWWTQMASDVQADRLHAATIRSEKTVSDAIKDSEAIRRNTTTLDKNQGQALDAQIAYLKKQRETLEAGGLAMSDDLAKLNETISTAEDESAAFWESFRKDRQEYVEKTQLQDLRTTGTGRMAVLQRFGYKGRSVTDATAQNQAIDLALSLQEREKADQTHMVSTPSDFVADIQKQIAKLLRPRSVWDDFREDAQKKFGDIADNFSDAIGEIVAKGGTLKSWWKNLWGEVVSWFTSFVVKSILSGLERIFTARNQSKAQSGGSSLLGSLLSVAGAASTAGSDIGGAENATGTVGPTLANANAMSLPGLAGLSAFAGAQGGGGGGAGGLGLLAALGSKTGVGLLSKIGLGGVGSGIGSFMGAASPWILGLTLLNSAFGGKLFSGIGHFFSGLFGHHSTSHKLMFDDPVNDKSAVQSGQDFTNMFAKGFARGMAKLAMGGIGQLANYDSLSRMSPFAQDFAARAGGYSGTRMSMNGAGMVVHNTFQSPMLLNGAGMRTLTGMVDRNLASDVQLRYKRGTFGGRDRGAG